MSGIFRGLIRAISTVFTPSGNILANNVQAALEQVDTRITNLDTANVKTTGNQTIGGNKTFSSTITFGSTLQISGTSGSNRDFLFSSSGIGRWRFRVNNQAETGGNQGSNFQLISLDDAGNQIDTPVSLLRPSGGAITFGRSLVISSLSNSTSSTSGAISIPNGGIGVGGESFFAGAVTINHLSLTRQSLAPGGTTLNLSWTAGNIAFLSLGSASGNVNVTLTGQRIGFMWIEVLQGATPRNLIFPTGTLQSGGGGNIYVGVANRRDLLRLLWNGSNLLIDVTQNYS